jgi:hypothetical protein
MNNQKMVIYESWSMCDHNLVDRVWSPHAPATYVACRGKDPGLRGWCDHNQGNQYATK